jgi:hypothetical protein
MASSGGPDTPEPAARQRWLADVVDILESRRRLFLQVTLGLVALGLLVTILAPGLLPPRAGIGAAVAIASLLIGVAAALTADSMDLVVRGPRHVRASGGRLAAVLPSTADPGTAAAAVVSVLGDGTAGDRGVTRIGIAPASSDVAVTAWADALAVAIAHGGSRVLAIDLVTAGDRRPGLVDVARGDTRLGEVVHFEDDLLLARVGPGESPVDALAAAGRILPRLPSDIEVLVVTLPPLASQGALDVVAVLDRVLLVAVEDVTARVDLIAGLDAADAVGAPADVLLLQPDAPPADARPVPFGDEPAPVASVDAPEPEPRTEPVGETPQTAPELVPDVPAPVDAAAEPVPAEPLAPLAAHDPPVEERHDADEAPAIDTTDELEPIAVEGLMTEAAALAIALDHEIDDAPIGASWPDPTRDAAARDDVGIEPAPRAPADVTGAAADEVEVETAVGGEVEDAEVDAVAAIWGDGEGREASEGVVGGDLDTADTFGEDDDLPVDQPRVAAALQSLAQEIWGRELAREGRRDGGR